MNTGRASSGKAFIVSVIWNWAGVGVSLFTGFLLSPYLIHKLGVEGYGVWALSFALVEYYLLFDLGFRTATVKYVAHYAALGDEGKVEEVISTSFLYASGAAALVLGIVYFAAPVIQRQFQVSAAYRDSFGTLLLLVTGGWCLGMVFNLFGACLEAVRRFDLTSRVMIVTTAVRGFGTAGVLALGYGLVQVGIMVVISQITGFVLNYLYFRRIFAGRRIRPGGASWAALREMSRFGLHSFLGSVSFQVLNQSAPLFIGHYRSARETGIFTLPLRLLQYTADFIGRIGLVTNSTAAALEAKKESEAIPKLATFTNRYCLVVFMPLAVLLWTHGGEFFRLWVGEEMGGASAALLPVLLTGYMLAVVGQFSSSMLLLGLGKHQGYARGMAVEAIATLALTPPVIARYGLMGVAWMVSGLMILNRGLFVSWLMSRVTKMPLPRYLDGIYRRPLLAALPALALSYGLKGSLLPGRRLVEIFALGIVLGIFYYGVAFSYCLEPEHRVLVLSAARQRWNRMRTKGGRGLAEGVTR